MRILRRVVRAWSNSVRTRGILFQHFLSGEVVFLDRWRPNQDLTYAFPVRILLELLQGCLRSVFHLPLWTRLEAEQVRLRALALTELEARSLLILRSQIIALMGRPNCPDPSIWQNTCSLQDVTFVSNPVDWLKGLFPIENCMVQAFVRFSALRSSFFFKWSRACSVPHESFDNNDVGRLLVGALERRTAHQRVFFSLSFMLVWFIAFFIRFSREFVLVEDAQKEILGVIFRDVFTRVAVFDAPDLAQFWFQHVFHLIGSVCAACLPTVGEDHRPLIFQEVLLESGDGVYDCVPLDEERLISIFRHRFPQPIQYWHANFMLYGDEGRTQAFLRLSSRAVIGQLGASLVWSTWRQVYLPVFSSLFPEVNFQTPGSLSSTVSRSILLNIRHDHFSVNPALFADVLHQTMFSPRNEEKALLFRCASLMHNESLLKAVCSEMHLERMFLESVQAFLAAPKINKNSSEEELDKCSRSLALVMRQLPFCGYSFYQAVCLSHIVEELIANFFGVASCVPQNRRRVFFLGSRRMAHCFWQLVSRVLLDLQQSSLVSRTNKIRFLRQCRVLYDVYFVREKK